VSDHIANPFVRRIVDIASTLATESDRACPLVVSEYLKDILGDLLEVVFHCAAASEKEVKKLLNGFNAPIGSLAVRASLCRALGLISQKSFDVLNALREIRNHCAHSDSRVALNDKKIEHWVRVLRRELQEGNEPLGERALILLVFTRVGQEIFEKKTDLWRRHADEIQRAIEVTQNATPMPPSDTPQASHQEKENPKPE
jgi:DNA-binding MltR family transcriptional regulator